MRRRVPLAVLVAGCALAGGVLGAGAATVARPADPAPPVLPVVAEVRLDALERPQRGIDLDQVPPTNGILRSSLRLLVTLPSATALLAGRRAGGEVCLLALSTRGGTWRAACVPESTFRADGVDLAWSSTTTPRQRSASWSPEGAVRAGPSPAQ